MKLLTHNLLTSHVRGVGPRDGYPLRIQATEVRVNAVDFNPEFVSRMIPKMEWQALVEAAESLGHSSDLPRQLTEGYQQDEEFLRKAHHVLLEASPPPPPAPRAPRRPVRPGRSPSEAPSSLSLRRWRWWRGRAPSARPTVGEGGSGRVSVGKGRTRGPSAHPRGPGVGEREGLRGAGTWAGSLCPSLGLHGEGARPGSHRPSRGEGKGVRGGGEGRARGPRAHPGAVSGPGRDSPDPKKLEASEGRSWGLGRHACRRRRSLAESLRPRTSKEPRLVPLPSDGDSEPDGLASDDGGGGGGAGAGPPNDPRTVPRPRSPPRRPWAADSEANVHSCWMARAGRPPAWPPTDSDRTLGWLCGGRRAQAGTAHTQRHRERERERERDPERGRAGQPAGGGGQRPAPGRRPHLGSGPGRHRAGNRRNPGGSREETAGTPAPTPSGKGVLRGAHHLNPSFYR
uniref:tRNA methyltransferase 112 homolog n=1 Tax=Ornithorhynchus anatinus TaxID=9258 RepID=A0A6I8N6H1_ORNAN